ncbi:Ig-like domain-containing protein [Alkalihalobacillus deserti]|uniref:Ig-like domain-containing protein n=1 Tax=Alkalihalobacillus deserti TaxID=2879466 RepID=UPI001D139DB7|nr:Ig-like domain-containing protein [Alkalihalobacillus deserti]
MKNFVSKMFFLFTIVLCTLPFIHVSAPIVAAEEDGKWRVIDSVENVPLNKEWTIEFNEDVDLSAITSDHIFVKDERDQVVSTTTVLVDHGTTVKVLPPLDGYQPFQTYTLFVGERVYSTKERSLHEGVKQSFETGDFEEELSPPFETRSDSANEVIYQDHVIELEEETLLRAQLLSVEDNLFIFDGAPEEITKLEKGDIFILPPTEEYPMGWAKKVVSIKVEANVTSVVTEEPTMEEVLEEIDLSQAIPVKATDFEIDPELFPNAIEEVSEDGNEVVYSQATDPNVKITITTKNGDPHVKFEGIEVFPKGDNPGPAMLNGDITFLVPEIHLDTKGLNINHLEFTSGFESNLKLDFPMVQGFNPPPTQIPKLPIKIPVKAYGIAGASINLSLFLEGSGEVNLSVSSKDSLIINVGATTIDDTFTPFNRTRYTSEAKIGILKGTIKGKMGPRINVNAEVLQFTLGGINLDGGYKFEINGEVDLQNVCFNRKEELFLEANALIGKEPKPLKKYTLPVWSMPLNHLSTCTYDELLVTPNEVVLEPGEHIQLDLQGKRFNTIDELEFPDSNIKMISLNNDVVRVNSLGYVTARFGAVPGAQTTVMISYRNGEDGTVEAQIPITIAGNYVEKEKEEMIEIYSSVSGAIWEEIRGSEIHQQYPDIPAFSDIRSTLLNYGTESFIDGPIKAFYEEACYSCDWMFFPWLEEDIRWKVVSQTPKTIQFYAVEFEGHLTFGGNYTITLESENGDWKLADMSFESFEDRSLDLTREEAEKIIYDYYSQWNSNLSMTYLRLDSNRVQNWYTGEWYTKREHVFEVVGDDYTSEVAINADTGFTP